MPTCAANPRNESVDTEIGDYNGAVTADTTDQPTIKMSLNAVVFEDAKFVTANVKDFYLI